MSKEKIFYGESCPNCGDDLIITTMCSESADTEYEQFFYDGDTVRCAADCGFISTVSIDEDDGAYIADGNIDELPTEENHIGEANEKVVKLKFVQLRDMQTYFETFKESFELILSGNHTLNASYSISSNIGAIIKISIVEKTSEKELEQDNTLQVLQFVKNRQLSETDKLLKEEKIKLYEPTHFYLIKSNQFKDWTIRQALKDAKEEIDLLFSNLPDTHLKIVS